MTGYGGLLKGIICVVILFWTFELCEGQSSQWLQQVKLWGEMLWLQNEMQSTAVSADAWPYNASLWSDSEDSCISQLSV